MLLLFPSWKKAIANTKNKRLKTRYTYILAQLYGKVNDKAKASRYYAQVLKKNATYDMAFNAQINLALMYDATAGGSSADLKKTLRKMSRDDKNIEYLDMIYYALAGIAISESEYDEAIKLLKQSVLASTSNTKQKGLSYLKLADLYFDKPEYETSKYYYDSTLTALPQEHAEYFRAEAKRNSLEDLVKNLKTIAFEDSVQQLAKMSSTELDIYIDDMIAKIIEEEERKRFEEESAALNPINTNQTTTTTNTNTGGKWYFDNPTAVSFGYGEFARIWGNRKLEDNWRRKNKESVAPTMTENALEDSLAAKKDTFDVKSKAYYLRNIPTTQAAMDSSNARVIDAYYSLGMIYREQLDDKPRSVEAFEALLKRYPTNKYTLSSYYQLYRLNLSMGNKERAEYYRNLIIKQYPDSEYANILQNPNYLKELEAFKGRAAEFYGETFAAYEAQDYDAVIQNAGQAHIRFEKSDQLPRFDLLKAMAIGKTQKLDAFEAALKELVAKYPNGEERKEAENILKYIEGVRGGADEKLPDEKVLNIPVAIEQSLYRLNKDTVHYYVSVIGKMGFNNNPLKAKISDFNGEFYSLESLTIKNMMINPLSQLVYVEKFENAAKAKAYFETIKQKPEIYEGLAPEEYRHFIISAGNFNIYYKDKNIDKYLEFYKTNYANN
jgi:tetratricopeptide (TPR) repeat protein